MKQVFLLEDHHCVPEAQRLLADKIFELCDRPNTALSIEGRLSDKVPTINNELCSTLLLSGEISGGEYAIQKLSQHDIHFVQLDDPKQYHLNLDSLHRLFATLKRNNRVVQELRTIVMGTDPGGFPAKLERANLAFYFQSRGVPTAFHGETWGLLVHLLLNFAVDWSQWQIAERLFLLDEWRVVFTDNLPDYIDVSRLFECIDAAIEFYHLNAERDTVYADNIEYVLNTSDSLVFALGPFHHQNLSMLLRKRRIEVISVEIPYNGQEGDLTNYRRHIMKK